MTDLKSVSPARLLLSALLALSLAGCASYSSQVEPLRSNYGDARFAEAETFVDRKLEDEARLDKGSIEGGKFNREAIDASRGDVLLLLMEKAMLRLAADDPSSAVKLLRSARDQLDENFVYDTSSFVGDLKSLVADDRVRDYSGADYDHIMVRVMLALCDLLAGEGDAFAYAVQIGEKQEEIIGSPLGELKGEDKEESYKPRAGYSRVSLGAYLQGMVREEDFIFDEAARAYERALLFDGSGNELYTTALSRAKGEERSEAGYGTLQVFYLAGRGPHLVASRQNPTAKMVRMAGIILLLLDDTTSVIGQAPVPVPAVKVNDERVPALTIASGDLATATVKVLDVNAVASEQVAANMPLVAARALARRALKAVVAHSAGKAAGRGSSDADAVAGAVSLLVGAVATLAEDADTRSWTTLPAQIQAASLALPPGVNMVDFGGVESEVRISEGRNSYVVLLRPSLELPPKVVIDRYSQPLE